jgi:hypothetical protein
VILYGFYKVTSKTHKRVRIISRSDPWKVLSAYRYALGSRLHPWKEVRVSNVVQGQGERRGRPDSGDLAGGLGWGSSWGGSRSCGEPTWVLTHGGEATGGGRRWELCSGVPAARRGQQAGVEALLVQEGGGSVTCWRCKRPEGGVHREHRGDGKGGLVALRSLARRTVMSFYSRSSSRWGKLLAHQGERRQYRARHGPWGGSDVRGHRPSTVSRPLVGRRGGDARHARTGRAEWWHGSSGSSAWTDGPRAGLGVWTQRTAARVGARRRRRAHGSG